MPRERRAWEPGDVLSIVGRAHEGRAIFATDEDRGYFTDRLGRVFVPGAADLLAWAVLINHYHLVIRVRDEMPGTLFQRLNTVVARRERRRRGDHGAVFQDRYWSARVEGDGLLPLLTYVLGNPIHHGVVADAEALESYPWTAYPEVLGLRPAVLVDPQRTLELLHPDEDVARRILREAMAERASRWRGQRSGLDPCEEPGCRGERDGCALVHPAGAQDRNVAAEPVPAREAGPFPGICRAHDERADRRVRLLARGWRADDLLGPVCAQLGADAAAVRNGDRRRAESRARALIAHLACDGAGEPIGEVGALLGVSGTAASVARRRGRQVLAELGWDIDIALSRTAPGS